MPHGDWRLTPRQWYTVENSWRDDFVESGVDFSLDLFDDEEQDTVRPVLRYQRHR